MYFGRKEITVWQQYLSAEQKGAWGLRALADTDLSAEEVLQIFNVNSAGPLRVCKVLLNLLKEGSAIMNISSEESAQGIIDIARNAEKYDEMYLSYDKKILPWC